MLLRGEERRQKILEHLRADRFADVGALAQSLSVSEVTIRSDLKTLEREGRIVRRYGGAILADEPRDGAPAGSFQERYLQHRERKQRIARCAAELVRDNDSLLLDASTTVFTLAEQLGERRNLTVFTNGIDVGLRLAANPANKVILVGGLLRADSRSLGAHFGAELLGGVRVRLAFLSCTGWSADLDATEDDLFEGQIKALMVQAAEQVVILADSSKFERRGLASFVPIRRISRILSDDELDETTRLLIGASGAALTLCGDSASAADANLVRTNDWSKTNDERPGTMDDGRSTSDS